MKNAKDIKLLSLALASVFALSGCSWLSFKGVTNHSTSTEIKTSETSKATSTLSADTSIEEVDNPIAKTKFNYNYKDYSKHSYFDYDFTPSVGNPKLLVIPVWFTDSAACINTGYRENVREDIETTYFGTEEETCWQSVKSYYYNLSQGRCNIDGVVTEWYECGENMNAYGYDENKTETLVKTASDWYFNQSGSLPRSYFDSDDDGYLDGVMLIYAAPDHAASLFDWDDQNDERENFWAYTSWTFAEPNKTTPSANAYFWASFDFMYDTSTANVRTGLYFYGSGWPAGTAYADSHTFIHEMGHMFGLPDYYDYSGQYCPAGSFSMQDHNVGSHDPYSALALGWADPYVPEDSCTLTIKPFQNDGRDLILLQPSGFNVDKSPFDEYVLIELFTPTGLNELDCEREYRSGEYYGMAPQGPQETGIRLWHVDARLVQITSRFGRINVDASHPRKVPNEDDLYFMMSNTYDHPRQDMSGRISVCGSSYANYNILQLLRNDSNTTYYCNKDLRGSDLFKNGDTFTCSKYSAQFVNARKLNSGDTLGWTIKVSIEGSGVNARATLELTRD